MQTHLIVVDTETGGLDPLRHSVIELAAIHAVIDARTQSVTTPSDEDVFHALVLPDRPVNAEAAAINGYDPVRWAEDARSFHDVALYFSEWLDRVPAEDLVWTGSNVLGFDLPFLRDGFSRCGVTFPSAPKFGRRTLNTESLCFPLRALGIVDSCGVSALRKWADRPGEQRHSAIDDALDTLVIVRTYFERCVWGKIDNMKGNP